LPAGASSPVGEEPTNGQAWAEPNHSPRTGISEASGLGLYCTTPSRNSSILSLCEILLFPDQQASHDFCRAWASGICLKHPLRQHRANVTSPATPASTGAHIPSTPRPPTCSDSRGQGLLTWSQKLICQSQRGPTKPQDRGTGLAEPQEAPQEDSAQEILSNAGRPQDPRLPAVSTQDALSTSTGL
jgi:hypothetical protein